MSVRLTKGGCAAEFSPQGAEWRVWRVGGQDLLWPGDPAIWGQIAPVLFPVVGWCRDNIARIDGHTVPMPVHGFAAHSVFDVEQTAADRAVLRLTDSDATRVHYPFSFRLDLAVELGDRSVQIAMTVHNTDTRAMPYACGLHPGFRWPLGDEAAVVFDREESPEVPVIVPGGLFTRRKRHVELVDRTLRLAPEMFATNAVCFFDAASPGVEYRYRDGAIRIDHDNFPHWAIWSRPPGPFLCVESWTGFGDPEGFEGDLFAKPGMRVLKPGERATQTARYEFRPSAKAAG